MSDEKDPNVSPDGSPYQYSAHPPGLRPQEWQSAEPSVDPAKPQPPEQPAARPSSAAAVAEEVAKEADEKTDELEKQKAVAAEQDRSSYKTRAARAVHKNPADE